MKKIWFQYFADDYIDYIDVCICGVIYYPSNMLFYIIQNAIFNIIIMILFYVTHIILYIYSF